MFATLNNTTGNLTIIDDDGSVVQPAITVGENSFRGELASAAEAFLLRRGWRKAGHWSHRRGDTTHLHCRIEAADRPEVDPALDLVSVTEIAERLGRTVGAVHQLRRRNEDFPEPLATLATGPVWHYPDVAAWAAIPRPTGRPRK